MLQVTRISKYSRLRVEKRHDQMHIGGREKKSFGQLTKLKLHMNCSLYENNQLLEKVLGFHANVACKRMYLM